jgi:Tol biopolymer transport system component
MTLSAGTRLGPYEITGAIGAGGMGEVFRARDTKLNRDVAIKVLPAEFASDQERVARFKREAQILASLNHPNIAGIYGLEETGSGSGAVVALVMELVDGEDLAVRLRRGALPVDEAIAIARQIAEALEEAHEHGIIHRDLKPANVKVTPDGKVKVLDFGLAKAMEGAGAGSGSGLGSESAVSHSPTISRHATEAGLILGTAAYMSPEQARGKKVDRRADIWSFGVVLFEMLSGERLFAGETVTDVLAAVVRAEPDWSLLPGDLPPTLRVFLRRCLQKDAKQRVGDIHDVRLALEGGFDVAAPLPASASAAPIARRPSLAWVGAAVAFAALAALAAWQLKPTPVVDRPVTRFSLVLDESQRLASSLGAFNWSPDGRRLAFRANGRLFVRDLDSLKARELTAATGNGQAFSPDGKTLLYRTASGLSRLPLGGGPPQELLKLETMGGAAWIDNERIVYSDGTTIFRMSANGGASEPIVKVSPPGALGFPEILPGGRAMIYAESRGGRPFTMVKRLDSDEKPRELVPGAPGARYIGSGHLIFGLEGRVMVAPFDARRLELTGPATPIPESAYVASSGLPSAAVSDSGSLAYLAGDEVMSLQLSWVDERGQRTTALGTPRNYSDIALSPDGRRVVAHLWDQDNDIWIGDLTRGALTRITYSVDTEEETPVWSPDGREVAYAATREGRRFIFRKSADGGASTPETKVWESKEHSHLNSWSPDGRTMLVQIRRDKTLEDVLAVDVATGVAKDVLASQFSEGWARFSPDGRSIAYASDESGRFEVYVQPYPTLNTRAVVSTTGGVEPVWSPDGRKLYFRSAENVMVAEVTSASPIAFSQPHPLFADRFTRTQGLMHTHFDVGKDGRLLMIESPTGAAGGGRQEIQIVLNWSETLKRLAPGK